MVSSLGEEQRRAPDEAALRRTLALARGLQLTYGRGVELQEGGDHLVYTRCSVGSLTHMHMQFTHGICMAGKKAGAMTGAWQGHAKVSC